MYSYSKKSTDRLITAEPRLYHIFMKVLEKYDHTILEGHRSKERQEELFTSGASKVKVSKHNSIPSQAVDVSPYPIPDHWGDFDPKERAKFYHFAGYVKAVADDFNTPIKWGGDWDGDFGFRDQTFDDLVHFELIGDN